MFLMEQRFKSLMNNEAKQILTEHIDKLHAVAGILLEKEKIESDEFEQIFA